MKFHIMIIPFLIFFIILSVFFPFPASALTMSNNNFILHMSTLDTAGGNVSNSNYQLGFSLGETAPGLLSGDNFKVRSGFEYTGLTIPFTFSISDNSIDFGILSPTNPVIRTNTMSISNGSGYGYTVTGFENHPLQTASVDGFIPDTSCDDGTCNQIQATTWTNTLTYGFGYRCDNLIGSDCNNVFENSSFFRQFADISKSETPQTIMQGPVAGGKKVQITYKINISGTQASGDYSNAITYVATPTF